MKYNWPLIKIDPLWYAPIDPPDPEDPGEPGFPVLPGLGAYLRKRYTSNTVVAEEMTVADLINDVFLPSCRGYVNTGPNGKIRMRNKKPADYAYALAALTGTTISADDVSAWVASTAQSIVIDPHTVNSEVRTVTAAVYPTTQNSTTLTSSHPAAMVVTAFSGAAGGSTPATATVTVASFVASTTYTITLDGIELVFTPGASDTTTTIVEFIAGAFRGDPRLNRKFYASVTASNVVTIRAKFGTMTINSAMAMTHTAPIANPAAAPTLTATASGSLPAGVYRVAYTWKNSRGQTLLSPFKSVTLAANEKITVTAVTPPAGTTAVWYVSVEAGSDQLRYHSENNGASFVIDWPLPNRSASMPPAFNRTGAEIIRVAGVYSDRGEVRSAIGESNVLKGTFKWSLGSRRSRKNVIELTYRQANADYRLVTLRERDDVNIAKVKEKRTEKINGQAIDNYFQAKRITSGILAESLDADFFYSWESTRGALLQEEGDVVVITDEGSGAVNLPVWIEELEVSATNSGLPRVQFTAHKYYSALYDDSINEVVVPIISEL
jgi:hypothetical protein